MIININSFKIFLKCYYLENIRSNNKTKVDVLQKSSIHHIYRLIVNCWTIRHLFIKNPIIFSTYLQNIFLKFHWKNYTLFEDTLNHHYFRYATHDNLKRHVAATRCKEIFPRMHKCRTHSHKISKETIKN